MAKTQTTQPNLARQVTRAILGVKWSEDPVIYDESAGPFYLDARVDGKLVGFVATRANRYGQFRCTAIRGIDRVMSGAAASVEEAQDWVERHVLEL